MNLKFSSYLTDIENKNRIRKYKKLELINVSKSSIEKEFNTTFRQMEVLGRIGGGTKTHRITINAAPTPDGWIVWNAESYCGSQKWTPYGHSQIFAFESNDMSKVTCDKCLGIRVKGGKAPLPKSTRPKIDPMLRPRFFNFEYKESHPLVSNRVTHESHKDVRGDSAKGLTAEIDKKENYRNFTQDFGMK